MSFEITPFVKEDLDPLFLPDYSEEVHRWLHTADEPSFQIGLFGKKANRLCRGLNTAGLHIFAAESGIGKTNAMVQVTLEIARSGTPILFESVELPASKMHARLLGQSLQMTQDEIETLKTNLNQNEIDTAMDATKNMPLMTAYDRTIERIVKRCMTLQKQYGIQYVVIDHFSEISTETHFRSSYERTLYIVRGLDYIMKTLNITVLMAVQFGKLNKPNLRFGGRQKGEIIGPGELVQKADNIFYIYYTEEQHLRNKNRVGLDEPFEATLKFLKARYGEEDIPVDVFYDKLRGRFMPKYN
jgi:replicative DNA helicase